MSAATTTTDHDEIKEWTQERDGRPARVASDEPGGILRIDFGEPEEGLEEISWEEFFQIFDQSELAFLYQEDTGSGERSRFNKFVRRNT